MTEKKLKNKPREDWKSIEEGSFVLSVAPELNESNSDSYNLELVQEFYTHLKELKAHKINPIICSDNTTLTDKWSKHPFIRALFSSPDKVLLNDSYELKTDITFSSGGYTGFFTSGSTGEQKLIIHADSSLELSARESLELINSQKEEIILCALPLYHIGGFLQLIRKFEYRANVKIVAPKELYRQWQKFSPKCVIGVPSQLQAGLSQDLPPTVFYTGGSGLKRGPWLAALEKGFKVISTYGLSESAGAILYQHHPDQKTYQYPSCKIKIDSQQRLTFHTKRLLRYIMELSEGGPRSIDDTSFFKTQDRAKVDLQGRISILGRFDKMIVCSGENIDPQYILQIIDNEYSFDQVRVIGFDHPKLGEIPTVFIKPFPNFKNSEEKERWTKKFASHFHQIKRPRLLLPFPSHTGIKPSYQELLAAYEQFKKGLYLEIF